MILLLIGSNSNVKGMVKKLFMKWILEREVTGVNSETGVLSVLPTLPSAAWASNSNHFKDPVSSEATTRPWTMLSFTVVLTKRKKVNVWSCYITLDCFIFVVTNFRRLNWMEQKEHFRCYFVGTGMRGSVPKRKQWQFVLCEMKHSHIALFVCSK